MLVRERAGAGVRSTLPHQPRRITATVTAASARAPYRGYVKLALQAEEVGDQPHVVEVDLGRLDQPLAEVELDLVEDGAVAKP